MLTYDVHQHFWPEALMKGLCARQERPRLRDGVLELPSGDSDADLGAHTLEARLALLDRDEIDVAMISCPPTFELDEALVESRGHRPRLSRPLAGACAPSRPARFATGSQACASRRGTSPASRRASRSSKSWNGAAGCSSSTPGRRRFPRARPPGGPPSSTTRRRCRRRTRPWIALGADRWPDLRVVFAILAGGAPIQLERLASRGVDTRSILRPNVFLDTASYGELALELALATYGVAQLVYGSDTPVVDSEPTLRSVRSFGSFWNSMRVGRLLMDDFRLEGETAEYHWTLVGTNTGHGGTGHKVQISGFEEWTIGDDGLIAASLGHFDQAEYDRQLEHGAGWSLTGSPRK